MEGNEQTPGHARGETALALALDAAAPQLTPVRAAFHPASVAGGLPLHLTLLYPFLPRAAWAGSVSDRIGRICGRHAVLSFELARVITFPGGFVCVAPEPDDQVRELMRSLWDEFPETPPYGGAIDDPVPHATVGWSPDGDENQALVEAVRLRVEPLLPIRCEIASVAVFESHEPERWRLVERIPLAVPPVGTIRGPGES